LILTLADPANRSSIGPSGFTREERVNGVGSRRAQDGHARIRATMGLQRTPGRAQNSAMISRDARVNILIGNGHFLSHFYTLSLPPLFLFLQNDFHITYAEIGLVPVVM